MRGRLTGSPVAERRSTMWNVTVWRARQERKLPLRAGSCREPDIAGQPSESDHSPLNTSLPTKWARGASPTRGETGQASLRLSRRAVTRRSPGWSRRPGRASTAAHASLAYPRPPASGVTRTRSPPRRAPSCEIATPRPQGVDRSPGRTVLIIDPGAIRYCLDTRHRNARGRTIAVLPPGVIHDGGPASCVSGTSTWSRLHDRLVGAAIDQDQP